MRLHPSLYIPSHLYHITFMLSCHSRPFRNYHYALCFGVSPKQNELKIIIAVLLHLLQLYNFTPRSKALCYLRKGQIRNITPLVIFLVILFF